MVSGMFANRFTAGRSPPITAVQGEPLPYPAGVGDLESLIGAPFDSAAYAAVPQLISPPLLRRAAVAASGAVTGAAPRGKPPFNLSQRRQWLA